MKEKKEKISEESYLKPFEICLLCIHRAMKLGFLISRLKDAVAQKLKKKKQKKRNTFIYFNTNYCTKMKLEVRLHEEGSLPTLIFSM